MTLSPSSPQPSSLLKLYLPGRHEEHVRIITSIALRLFVQAVLFEQMTELVVAKAEVPGRLRAGCGPRFLSASASNCRSNEVTLSLKFPPIAWNRWSPRRPMSSGVSSLVVSR